MPEVRSSLVCDTWVRRLLSLHVSFTKFRFIKLNHVQVRHLDKALVAIARQLHEVRERHKAKGFAIEPVSPKIQALMSTEDKEEDEVRM